MNSFFKKFPYVAQHDAMDCGPSCLAMIALYHGKKWTIQQLREFCHLSRDGVSLLGIQDGAERIGFDTLAVKISSIDLIDKKPLPCILHWNSNHFVVLYNIQSSIFSKEMLFEIMDPSHGKVVIKKSEFDNLWMNNGDQGLMLLLSPSKIFHDKEVPKTDVFGIPFIRKFIALYRSELFILIFGLVFTSLFTLGFPFLTQALVDIGVNSKNLSFVSTILLAQLFLFLGSLSIEIIRSRVLVFINSKINISIISDFLTKIIRLPFKFFDTKQLGDFSSRIGDHQRIEEFLTSQSLIVIFSSLNFVVFFIVLSYYDFKILTIFIVLTTLSVLWSSYFIKQLKKTDYHRFRYQSEGQQAIYELINGIIEVKLNGIEDYKVSKWKGKQFKLFDINLQILKYGQLQHVGYDFINQTKNILVVFIAAREVILGNITLGTLLSISYIVGQMNSPLNHLIEFLKSWQYAKLSFERLNEVQNMEEEDHSSKVLMSSNEHISIENLSYQYHGPRSPFVLEDVNVTIPKGKTTAIVGESGSGKTTLMKLMLKFYQPVSGKIRYGRTDLESISAKSLRKHCGVVMQDGYIFSDTLQRNIATHEGDPDKEMLNTAIRVANLGEFIASLPQGLNTMLGSGGNGISGGQRQRILIARAVYKNPDFIFFDEATSSLDADNERIIYDNLEEFFKGKTVLKIAHRLSTVKNADQIIVLKKGKIIERGTHTELVHKKASYFKLVKNQLELSA